MSFYEFVKLKFEQNEYREIDDEIRTLCNTIQEYIERGDGVNLVIETTRRYSDVVINVYLPLWMWENNTKYKQLNCSLSATRSNHFGGILNREYKEKRDGFQKSLVLTKENGYSKYMGVGGTICGMHFDTLVFTDPLFENNNMYKDRFSFWFDQTVGTRKIDKNKSIWIIVNTLEDDFDILLKKHKYNTVMI